MPVVYKEFVGDLFSAQADSYLAHCISADYALGAGIAKEFDRLYDMRRKLNDRFPHVAGNPSFFVGRALPVENVFNCVTKEHYYDKPTYADFTAAIKNMAILCNYFHVRKLAIPRLGAGLDRLDWIVVKEIIFDSFKDLDIEITCYKLKEW